MTTENYSKNYIKIYLWRFVSLLSGFLSLLIVVPHLSNNQELYGIYAFCITFTLYLTYADIGFLRAGQKYAAEEYAKGNSHEEIEIFGFTAFILLLMILPFSLTMIYFSFNPGKIISNLSVEGQKIAGQIFLILGVLAPFQIILQRLAQSILIIRIKDFISLRIDIVFNLIKIGAVFFFFANGKYHIVEYFLFINLLTIIGASIAVVVIRRTEKYDFIALFKAIKFSSKYFQLTKGLALSSLFLTVGWLIYYELDVIFIGRLFGPQEVAIYAIGFTFLNFLRSLWNVVYSPYSQRFNHFVGTGSLDEMKEMARKIMDYTFPLCVVVTTILVISTEYIVPFWVGNEFSGSIPIMQILILGTAFGFVVQPASYYFMAKTRYLYIYSTAIILPFLFIIGLLILTPRLGLEAFAFSKTIAMVGGFIISMIGISELINPLRIIVKWTIPIIVFLVLVITIQPIILSTLFPIITKSTTNLIFVIALSALLVAVSLAMVYTSRKSFRIKLIDLIKGRGNFKLS